MAVRNLALAVLSATPIPAQPAITDDEFSRIADAADRLASSGKPVYTLSILGYNARWLQYGTMRWSRGDKLIVPFKGLPADRKDYPIVVAR
jgi:hypothetical protein